MSEELKGRRIAVLATDGFEKVELTIPVAALRSAGAEVDIVSLHGGTIRGVNLHEPADKVENAFPLPKFKTLLTVGAIAAGIYAFKNSGAMQRQFDRVA